MGDRVRGHHRADYIDDARRNHKSSRCGSDLHGAGEWPLVSRLLPLVSIKVETVALVIVLRSGADAVDDVRYAEKAGVARDLIMSTPRTVGAGNATVNGRMSAGIDDVHTLVQLR